MNIISLSYGKDSLALFGACEELGIPIDGAVHAEIWATDDIPADLPPMVEFKKKTDAIIKERWGIEVKHICALWGGAKNTYQRTFYKVKEKGNYVGRIYGFPMIKVNWCAGELKVQTLKEAFPNDDVIQMLGIAADEPVRIERHKDKKGVRLPLVEIGWTEADCRQWCIDNDLLSPIYTDTCLRGGCWFCHNQGIQQLRELRHNYPDLWQLLLKWDSDSPVTFRADGHTVHDFDRRFEAEDKGFISKDNRFHWKDLNMQQYTLDMMYRKKLRGEEE